MSLYIYNINQYNYTIPQFKLSLSISYIKTVEYDWKTQVMIINGIMVHEKNTV